MKLFSSCTLLSMGLLVCGAAIAQTPPTAGLLNQRIEGEQRSPPTEAAPEIRIEQGAEATPAASAGGQTILVKRLRITGASLYPEATLVALTGFSGERELTLAQLRAMATRIADHYHKEGYLLAQAYLPAQQIKAGVVTIAVLEGRYGEVSLHNQSKLADGVAAGLLAGLRSGDTVALAPLESRLLLLSDIPGVEVKSTLVPGASVGASDLIVDVLPGQRFSGSASADNLGDRYTGDNRLGGTLNFNNPTGRGDVVSVRALSSDAGLHYGRAAYQTRLGRATAGVAYSHMEYRLGEEFDSLDAHGTASIASLYGSYPLIRSRHQNLNVQLDLDSKAFRDEQDTTGARADRQAHVAMLSLSGNTRDGFGGGGWSAYSLTWSAGSLDIQSPAARTADAATARSDGRYDKLSFSVQRLQRVNDRLSLYVAINGQLASKNLDSSEKLGLGGAYGVRAYPSGEAYGDQGYVLHLEARRSLPGFAGHVPGQLQLSGFVDTGRLRLNKNAWADGDEHRSLSGAGVGLNWRYEDEFAASATFARRLGSDEARSEPDDKSRFWLQATMFF